MDIILYNNNSERIVRDKDLTVLETKTGTFRETGDVIHPSFLVDASAAVATCDYAQIASFGRYYYVTGKKYITKDLVMLQLETDLRQSFRQELLQMEGIVQRQRDNYDMYLPDSRIPASVKRVTTVRNIGDVFNPNARANIMIVAGGK